MSNKASLSFLWTLWHDSATSTKAKFSWSGQGGVEKKVFFWVLCAESVRYIRCFHGQLCFIKTTVFIVRPDKKCSWLRCYSFTKESLRLPYVCLLDREPVWPQMIECDRYEKREEPTTKPES